MAKLSTNPLTVASLNAILASRHGDRTDRYFDENEIADLVQAMAQDDSAAPRWERPRFSRWNWKPAQSA